MKRARSISPEPATDAANVTAILPDLTGLSAQDVLQLLRVEVAAHLAGARPVVTR